MTRNSSGTLGAWGARLWARRLLVLACVVAGLLAGLAAAQILPRRYAATAVVNVAPLTVNQFGTSQSTQAVNMESERSAVTSTGVVERAARTLGGVDSEVLKDSLAVVVPSQSLTLKITSTTRDAQQSARWANAVADAYLADRTASADDAAAKIIQRLQAEIDDRLKARATQAPADRSLTDQDVAALRERISTLTTVGLNPGRVIGPADAPTEASTLSLPALIVAGQALGLLLGIALALIADHVGRRVRTGAHLAWTTGWSVYDAQVAAAQAQLAAAERVLALRPAAGDGRFVALDLTGTPGADPTAAVRAQVRELGQAEPERPVLNLTADHRPTAAAALTRPGDVALVAVATDTPIALVRDVADVLATRGATVAGALLHPAAGRVDHDTRDHADPADASAAARLTPAAPGATVGEATGAQR